MILDEEQLFDLDFGCFAIYEARWDWHEEKWWRIKKARVALRDLWPDRDVGQPPEAELKELQDAVEAFRPELQKAADEYVPCVLGKYGWSYYILRIPR